MSEKKKSARTDVFGGSIFKEHNNPVVVLNTLKGTFDVMATNKEAAIEHLGATGYDTFMKALLSNMQKALSGIEIR
jgi:hypothetical protein